MGNHEVIALACINMLFYESEKIDDSTRKKMLDIWISQGGIHTVKKFMNLSENVQKSIICYLSNAAVYFDINVKGRNYFLAHTVPSREKMLSKETCAIEDFTIATPNYNVTYYPDKFIVTGHTPTKIIDKSCNGKIIMKNNHISIDCGCGFGGNLGCICLDNLEEIYIE